MSETETDQEENKKQLKPPANLRILKSMESLLRTQSKMLKQLINNVKRDRDASSDEDEDVPLAPKPKKPSKKRKYATQP